MEKINEKIFRELSKRMQKKAGIINLLEEIGLNHLEVLKVKRKSKRNLKRRTTIVDTLNTINGGRQKIIIDIKQGLPSWQYMMEVTFKSGSDCDIKIVIYDDTETDDLNFDEEIAVGFTKTNNQSGGKIYLLKIKQTAIDEEGNIYSTIIQKPSVINLCNPQEHPSIEDFKRAEYWVQYHYYFSALHYQIVGTPEIWLKYQIYEEIQDTGFLVYWTEDGFFLDVMGQSEDTKNLIKSKCLADLTEIEDCFLNKELIPAAHCRLSRFHPNKISRYCTHIG